METEWGFLSTFIRGFLVRKSDSGLTLPDLLHDNSANRPYSGRMRKRNCHPLESAAPSLFAGYPATSPIGINIRRGDARLRLKEMDKAEEDTRRQETEVATIADRLDRMQADHELNMRYLMQFGITASEREDFHQVLEAVAEHGGLSLREAANLVHARHHRNGEDAGPSPDLSSPVEVS